MLQTGRQGRQAHRRPLIMSFQQFFGLGDMVHESTLAMIPVGVPTVT